VSLVLGILLGGISGYFGGTIELLQAIPRIPLWRRDRLRQVGAQQGGCFGLVTEHGTEQVIVGLRDFASHTLFYGVRFAGALKTWQDRLAGSASRRRPPCQVILRAIEQLHTIPRIPLWLTLSPALPRDRTSPRPPSTWAPARCASSSGTWCRRSAAT